MLRTEKYPVLLVLAAVLGVVISFLTYWFLKLIAEMQAWVFTDLFKGLGFHGEPSWWPLLPLAVAGVIVGAAIRYLPGRGGHSPADGFKASGVAQANELPGILLAALASIGLGVVVGPEAPVVGPEAPVIALGGGLAVLAEHAAFAHALPPHAGARTDSVLTDAWPAERWRRYIQRRHAAHTTGRSPSVRSMASAQFSSRL